MEVTQEQERTRSSFESHVTWNKTLLFSRQGWVGLSNLSKPAAWSELTKLFMDPKKAVGKPRIWPLARFDYNKQGG